MSDLEKVFGIHAVESLLDRQSERITELWLQQGRNDKRAETIQQKANKLGVRINVVSKQDMDGSVEGRHQGVLAFAKPAKVLKEKDLESLLDSIGHQPLILILDGITDPHNLGACLRTADAVGVDAVVAPKDNSSPLTAIVSKVACGAVETVPYIQVTNLVRTMKDLQQRGIWITGTAGEAEQSLYDADLKGAVALVMGAEGKGMRRLTRENCDFLVKLPMAGSVSSLNVSVATGVCLYEVVRQRV